MNAAPAPAGSTRRTAIAPRAAGLLIPAAILASAALLRAQQLTTVSFWFDEACAWRIAGFPWDALWEAIARDAHPPLFFLIERGWQTAWGTSVVAARCLSVLCGLAAVALAWIVSSRISASAVRHAPEPTVRGAPVFPILAASLLAASPLQIELSQSARPYALGTLLALLAAACLLHAIDAPQRPGAWVGFALAALGLTMTHYYGLLTVAGFVSFLLLEIGIEFQRHGVSARLKQLAAGLLGSLACWQLVWAGWSETFFRQQARANAQLWMHPLTWSELERLAWKTLAGGAGGESWERGGLCALAAWILLPAWLVLRGGAPGRLLGLGVLVPVALSVGYSVSVRNILGVRYLIFAQTFLLLGLACTAAGLQKPWLRRLACAGLLLWSSIWCWDYGQRREVFAQASGLRQAAEYLNAQRLPKAPVIVSSPFVYVPLSACLQAPERACVQYGRELASDLLGGPPLLPEDIERTSLALNGSQTTLWTVDALGIFGGDVLVQVPGGYDVIREVRFPERQGIPMDVQVRKLRRKADGESPR